MSEPRYAVNLADLSCQKLSLFVAVLIAPVAGEPVDVWADRVDGILLPLECDQERAEAIVAVIRQKYDKNHVRVYCNSGKAWKPV